MNGRGGGRIPAAVAVSSHPVMAMRLQNMLLQNHRNPRLTRSAAAVLLGAALAAGFAVGPAAAQEDDTPAGRKVMDSIMSAIGFQRPGAKASIGYPERSPLVIPPTRDLPPPEANSAQNNPAWPVDPDVKKRRDAAKQGYKTNPGYGGYMEEQQRPLTPDELAKGRVGRTPTQKPRGADGAEDHRPSKPWEIGAGNVFTWNGLFGAPKKEESVPFAGEPSRTELTQPPPGYQTPSPSHPYGVGPPKPTQTIPEDRNVPVR
jgi:hypothetical protein